VAPDPSQTLKDDCLGLRSGLIQARWEGTYPSRKIPASGHIFRYSMVRDAESPNMAASVRPAECFGDVGLDRLRGLDRGLLGEGRQLFDLCRGRFELLTRVAARQFD
jgi:hypothetical protein